MPAPKLQVNLSGPFFQRDPAKTFRQNVRKMMEALAEEGESGARSFMGSGNSGRLPIARLEGHHVSEYVRGRVRSLTGKQWALTAVVSVNNSGLSRQEGVSLMAAASRVEKQTRTFRQLTSRIRSSRAVLAANLTEGLE